MIVTICSAETMVWTKKVSERQFTLSKVNNKRHQGYETKILLKEKDLKREVVYKYCPYGSASKCDKHE